MALILTYVDTRQKEISTCLPHACRFLFASGDPHLPDLPRVLVAVGFPEPPAPGIGLTELLGGSAQRAKRARLPGWVWVKIQPPGIRPQGYSMFTFTRGPFWGYPIFDPQPNDVNPY